MYRQFGNSALLLLLITSALSHVAGPGRWGAVKDMAPGVASTASPPSVIETEERACYVFEALRHFLGGAPAPAGVSGGSDCSEANFNAIFPSGIEGIDAANSQVLMATVPDPLQSSEALQFDRDIAALQEAASTAGYDFQWMNAPWYASDLAAAKDFKDAREVDQYREIFGDKPGALLFRKRTPAAQVQEAGSPSVLLIVLVPESPVYGLNLAAAREGLNAVRTLLKYHFRSAPVGDVDDAGRVRWIGPSYSASAPGLRQLKAESQPHLAFDALSGSISTPAANNFLLQRHPLDKENDAKATLNEMDTDALCSFLGQETRSSVRSDVPVAVVQEDETAYGGNIGDPSGFTSPCSSLGASVRRFSFPRGISHVRRMYGETLKNATSGQQQPQAHTGDSTNIPFSFQDELDDPEDRAPEFAPQSPVSNESVLAAIASDIKGILARSIIIRASDPLDELFLARYFRKECPDSRLVLFHAERLLTRLRGDFNLDGVLVVTRFPLFQAAYLQTPFRRESRHQLTFTNSREEAIFLAALLQIKPGHLSILQSPFGEERFEMAPWIGVTAGGAFWPVAYLGKNQIGAGAAKQNNVLLLTDLPPQPLSELWTLIALAVLVISVLHFLFFLAGTPTGDAWLRDNRREWARRIARHRMLSFYIMPISPTSEQLRLYTGQCWWLLNASTQLVLLLSYLLFPVIAYQIKVQQVPTRTAIFAGSTFVVLMLQCCMAGILFLRLIRHCVRLRQGFFGRFENGLLPILSLSWVFLSLGLLLRQLTDAQTGFAFASRCLRISSGVCPVLPLMLGSLSFLIAAAVNLNALSMAITRNPGLPMLRWPYLDLASWEEKLGGYTELWYGLPGADGKLLAIAIFLGCFLLHPRRLFATFDMSIMSWLYTLNFVFALWTVLWLWVRFIRIWGALRSGLDSLEGSPLRFAFSRLPAVFSIDPIWSYAGLRRVVVLPMRWFEYFKISPKALSVEPSAVGDAMQALRIILQETRDAKWLDNETYIRFSKIQNDAAVKLSETTEIQPHGCEAGRTAIHPALLLRMSLLQQKRRMAAKGRLHALNLVGTCLPHAGRYLEKIIAWWNWATNL
ncbi:hypothetical protein [Acidobacterium sp. S8]|uniref:hypothetical protein n=1 Tax=Acidobacterium sp. S8 TaxID=1641854 RepID=UPI00131D41B1|nr:hypothetical protein [Acidobacterium sp. S8]